MAFHFYDRNFLRKGKEKELFRTKPEFFLDRVEVDCPSYNVDNVHDEKWLEFIREKKPDIIFSICCSVIFKPRLFNIPRFGTFVLHEGLTPEYKGLHTPVWALLNREYHGLGYSLIKIDNKIDNGAVLDQGVYELQKDEGLDTWCWVGHNALIKGIPNVRKALAHLEENGGFEPISTDSREEQYYSWVPFSTFVRKKMRGRKRKK